jgi:hypothetical protein
MPDAKGPALLGLGELHIDARFMPGQPAVSDGAIDPGAVFLDADRATPTKPICFPLPSKIGPFIEISLHYLNCPKNSLQKAVKLGPIHRLGSCAPKFR